MTDEELAAVWRRWWDSLPYVIDGPDSPEEVEMDDEAFMAGRDLKSLQEHLHRAGFAIVRRMDPDLPG